MRNILELRGNEFVDEIKREAEELVKKKVSMHQLRNIFSQVKNIKKPEEIYLLRYRLAYIGSKNPALLDFVEKIDPMIRNIKREEELIRFKEFFEALVAYHKYFEEKRKTRR